MFIGITRVRNEEEIIQDTLDHIAGIVDAIVVYDDCSTDNTKAMCLAHPAVVSVVAGEVWNPVRVQAEWETRQGALEAALKHNPEWILCFDADERFEFPDDDLWKKHDGVRMRLFDFYITEADVDLPYTERKWMGPEYRDILMAYRYRNGMRYQHADQREMVLPSQSSVINAGFVKHYGKSISVKQWEDTCEYYATHFPEPYTTKWNNRRGKAIHTASDFGRPLIQWEDRTGPSIVRI
jgi:glycosyltransferase involved in cell wall biosynthesis